MTAHCPARSRLAPRRTGLGGMFVQSEQFMEAQALKPPLVSGWRGWPGSVADG